MEEKEREVHHKLRQHFGEKKFSSRVEIMYADSREDVQPYKSRYATGPNKEVIEAFKVQNFHNSKIF
jgi:hypothetical protein